MKTCEVCHSSRDAVSEMESIKIFYIISQIVLAPVRSKHGKMIMKNISINAGLKLSTVQQTRDGRWWENEERN